MVCNRTREVEVRKHFFEDDGRIPNNPELPLLVYPGLSESRTYLPRAARSYSRRTVGAVASSLTTTTTLTLTRRCA
jgi:hypothetical protein